MCIMFSVRMNMTRQSWLEDEDGDVSLGVYDFAKHQN